MRFPVDARAWRVRSAGVGARDVGQAGGARVVCANAGTKQPADRLAQRSVEINGVHALKYPIRPSLFDIPNIEIDLHPQAVALTL